MLVNGSGGSHTHNGHPLDQQPAVAPGHCIKGLQVYLGCVREGYAAIHQAKQKECHLGKPSANKSGSKQQQQQTSVGSVVGHERALVPKRAGRCMPWQRHSLALQHS